MKKIILIIITILSIFACVKSEVDVHFDTTTKFFYSECKVGNVEYYGNYNISENIDIAEMYLVRKERCTLDVIEYTFGDNVYTMNKDTVYIDVEHYHYTLEEFKTLLIKKNTLPRDTTIFKITNNMYCTWECFDNMYNKYVTSK
jgi:hypothetical protein